MNIFTLMGTILVNNTEANASISETGQHADTLSSKVSGALGGIAKAGAAIATGVGVGATALYGLATKSAEAADEVDKMSQKIGISNESYQEWAYIMGQNGMDVSKLQVGVKTLTAQMDAANSGTEGSIEAFKALGLEWDDGNGKLKSQEVMLQESIMALAGMENSTERARLATELFGKAGAEMAPMLNSGTDGIAELKDRAHELGLVMSNESVTAGVVLGDTLDDVKDSFGAVATKIGIEVMPIVQDALNWVLDNMPQIQEVASNVFSAVSDFVQVAVNVFKEYLVPILQEVFNFISDNWPTIEKIVGGVFKAIGDVVLILADNLDILLPILAGVLAGIIAYNVVTTVVGVLGALQTIVGVCTTVTGAFNAVLLANPIVLVAVGIGVLIAAIVALIMNWDKVSEFMSNLWDNVKEIFGKIADFIKDTFVKIWDVISSWFGGLLGNIVSWFKDILDTIVEWFGDLLDWYLSLPKKFLEAGKSIFTGLWDGIKQVWENIVNWVSEKIDWLVDKITFWKKSSNEMSTTTESNSQGTAKTKVNGSHANGLDYVPYDGYIAEVHVGEGILTDEENREYRQLKNKSNKQNITVDNSVSGNSGGVVNNYHISIDASKVQEFNDVIDMCISYTQNTRMGGEING